MLIENYKGIEIFHNAEKDEFYTKVVINKRSGKSDEYIKGGRLGSIRDNIDKFLNTAAKKPVLKAAWMKGKYEEVFEKVDIVILNAITNSVMVRGKDGKLKDAVIEGGKYGREDRLYLVCKENDAIVSNLNKKHQEMEKIKHETSCSSGKLIPLKPEHFV